MQRLEVSGSVRPLYRSLGVKGLILFSHLRLGFQSDISLKFPLQNPVYTLFCLVGATCSAHHIILDLFIRTMFGEEYRSLNSLLCSFLYFSSLNSPSNLIYDVIYSKYMCTNIKNVC